jgi:hypothetical protein
MSNRVFKVQDPETKMSSSRSFPSGKYTSSSPSGAALKGFNDYCKLNNIKGSSCKRRISVVDQESGKSYSYEVIRKKDPRVINIGGKDITFQFSTKAKSIAKQKKCIRKCRGK